VPKRKRVQREHTEDWQTIRQYTLWPEQTAYELLRPVVLFGVYHLLVAVITWQKRSGTALDMVIKVGDFGAERLQKTIAPNGWPNQP
jgi:hypothetical protein